MKRRGYLLLEAAVAAAVVLVCVSSVLGAHVHSVRLTRAAAAEQAALAFARGLLDAQRAAPADAAEWKTGARSGAVPGHPGWTWQVIVTRAEDDRLTAALDRRPTLLRARVSVHLRDRTLELEALRW